MNQTESSHHLHLPAGLRFAFVEASWHADIVHQARDAFFAEMALGGFGPHAGTPGLSLRIDHDQEAWSPEFNGELRVSNLQSGARSGE